MLKPKLYKKVSTKAFSFVLFLTFSLALRGQQFPFEKISLEKGLPNVRVNDFIQDSRGFYWLATEGTGLVRYDGYDFKSYTEICSSTQLFVNKVREDAKGNIWAGTEQGLLFFDGYIFKEYPLPDVSIGVKHMDFTSNGVLVVGDSQGGLWYFENTSWKKQHQWNRINDVFVQYNDVFIATNEALLQIEGDSTIVRIEGDIHAISYCDEQLFASTADTLWRIDKAMKIHFERAEGFESLAAYKKHFVGISEDALWIKNQGKRIGANNGLPDYNYKGVYVDNEGVIWLYSNNGLVKLESLAWQFFLSSSTIFSLYKSSKGDLYGGSVSEVNRFTREIDEMQKDEFPFGVALSMESYQNSIWLGTEKGLIKKTPSGYKLIDVGGRIQLDFIFKLKTALGKLWIGSGLGLLSFDGEKFINELERNKLPPAAVYHISEARDSSLWFGTFGQGFYRYKNGVWDVLSTINGVALDSINYSCFAAVSKDEIWLGSTGDGIIHITKNDVKHISFSAVNFAEIESMEIDDRGHVWAGTNKGLLEIRSEEDIVFHRLGMEENGGVSASKAIEITNNQVLVGTTKGIQQLDLNAYYAVKKNPKLAITGVALFLGQNNSLPAYAEDSLAFSHLPSQVELPSTLNFLSFNLAGLTGFQKERLHYRYRLLGQSEEWTMAGFRREAIFSDIKPGRYTFEAQVSRTGQNWGEEKVSYKFQILQPVYARWWFISLFIIAVATMSILYIRARVNRINQRLRLENALMEMERKALRLQMNPHFIFNALDSISSFIFKKDPQQAVKYLNNFAKLMRLTLESSMEHIHPVETEVSILKNYLELEKLRFKGKFEFSISLDDEIDYDVGIPPMLVQPHVENAILHGLKSKTTAGNVDIRFILEDDMLVVEVEDDGIGRKAAKALKTRKDHRSMATQINRDRLDLLRKSMSEKIKITIIDKEDSGGALGTKVIIRLPAEGI